MFSDCSTLTALQVDMGISGDPIKQNSRFLLLVTTQMCVLVFPQRVNFASVLLAFWHLWKFTRWQNLWKEDYLRPWGLFHMCPSGSYYWQGALGGYECRSPRWEWHWWNMSVWSPKVKGQLYKFIVFTPLRIALLCIGCLHNCLMPARCWENRGGKGTVCVYTEAK